MFNIHDDNNDKMAYFGDNFNLIIAFYELKEPFLKIIINVQYP